MYVPSERVPVVAIRPDALTVRSGLDAVVTRVTAPMLFWTAMEPAVKTPDAVFWTVSVVGEVWTRLKVDPGADELGDVTVNE
jgi:hypothetical protein